MENTYRALYRKWRPMVFEDVIGQAHISDTLKTAVAADRITHAYLFCGTRGTGKTSTAKIFSRAVNCEHPVNGEPCNECPTCKGILDGSILDVFELDAASNRGIDDIRAIRDEVIYMPAGCTYKVYIVDEVHMLTTEAFNALLKTLEEPPKHAIFILATTEPHKLPATVLSRCQRFDFHRIGVQEIYEQLSKIAAAESISATEGALRFLAYLGNGSMRDALSLLDRCAAFGKEPLSEERVAEIIGAINPNMLMQIMDAAADGDAAKAMAVACDFLKKGKEPKNLIEELIDEFRALLICKSVQEPAGVLDEPEERIAKLQEQAERFSVQRLTYSIRVLSEAAANAKWMSNPAAAVEVAIVKLCNIAFSSDADAILARLESLESELAIMKVQAQKPTRKKSAAEEAEKPPAPVEEQTEAPKEEAPVGEKVPWALWADALNSIKQKSKSLFAFMVSCKAYQEGDAVRLEFEYNEAYRRVATPDGILYLEQLFSGVAGKSLSVKAIPPGEEQNSEKGGIFELAEKKSLLGDKMTIIDSENDKEE